MNKLDQSVFDGQPPEVTLACVDYDGLLKFGKNVRNYRYTWASERWRGADWVEQRKGTDYEPLTSIRRKPTTPPVEPWMRKAGEHLSELQLALYQGASLEPSRIATIIAAAYAERGEGS